MTTNIVGNNIRQVRERLNLTQEELALRSNLTQAHINFIENGKRGYTKKSLAKIAKALGISVSQLFEEKKEIAPITISEPVTAYGKRKRVYDEIVAMLNKLPDAVVNHYKMLLAAELSIRSKHRK